MCDSVRLCECVCVCVCMCVYVSGSDRDKYANKQRSLKLFNCIKNEWVEIKLVCSPPPSLGVFYLLTTSSKMDYNETSRDLYEASL